MTTETNIIFMTLFYLFQQVVFSGKRSTIIFFKLCKFNVNLWTLCFLSYKKYPDPLGVGLYEFVVR